MRHYDQVAKEGLDGPKPKGPGKARSGPAGEEGFPEGCFAWGSVSLRPEPSL